MDRNGNGVRDEVERELANLYGGNSTQFAAVMRFARVLQLSLSAPTQTRAQAADTVGRDLAAFDCLVQAIGNTDTARGMAEAIAGRTFNTKNRLVAKAQEYDLSALTQLPEIGTATCS